MKIISWNVNGINACIRKGFLDFIKKEKADVYCVQELKVSPGKIPMIEGYENIIYPAEKNGYSGVAVFSKVKPISVTKGMEKPEFDREGRVLVAEFKDFYLVNAYFPHSSRELARLDFKLKFNKAFGEFCKKLEKKKPIVIASDFNVAHKAIDLANPKQNEKNAGFTIEEREWFDGFLKKGYVDTFRMFHKEQGWYTWWTYRFNARDRNIGWRIDYFVVSEKLKKKVKDSSILTDVLGSDHCPVVLNI